MRGATFPCYPVHRFHGISIHAPHAGRDLAVPTVINYAVLFQSTRPMRGATVQEASPPCRGRDFNPRAPCGARLSPSLSTGYCTDFNPRAPCGARLNIRQIQRVELGISIHAPHAGRDLHATPPEISHAIFQSTRPMRGATRRGDVRREQRVISIHAPHAGRDW